MIPTLYDLITFTYYRRYKWTEDDFAQLQLSILGYPGTLLKSSMRAAILQGLESNGNAALNVNYNAGVALSDQGDLCAIQAGGSVAVTNNVKSLIVVRPATAVTGSITRPTTPFDIVPFETTQNATVVAIAGDAVNYPAKQVGDVILFGVVAAGGAITDTDQTKAELLGKTGEMRRLSRFAAVVGNERHADYRTLAEAITAVAAGSLIRVLTGETINTTIAVNKNNLDIYCDPGVAYVKGTALTGFTFSGTGCKFRGARVSGFSGGGDKAINVTGNYNGFWDMRFANNTTDIDDTTNQTSQSVGVINE